jgi:FixJ family two-component response regulator
LRTGAFDYVAKPFEFAHLSRVVAAAVALGSDTAASAAE